VDDARLTLRGDAAGEYFGNNLRVLGDLDGDGLDDLVLGYGDAEVDGFGYAGRVYAWSGLPEDGVASAGTADLVVSGQATWDYVGDSVAERVDFDGDGALDLVVGAPATYSDDAGYVRIWYGPVTLAGEVLAADADGTVAGDPDDTEFAGGLVAAGDVDGDGFDDLWAGVSDVMCVLVRGGPRE
jgi:hypothetical protein